MQNTFMLFLLLSSLPKINSVSSNETVQRKILSRLQLITNFSIKPESHVIGEREQFSDDEHHESKVKKYLEVDRIGNYSGKNLAQRKLRDVVKDNSKAPSTGMECVSCNSDIPFSDDCYKGSPAKTQKCAESEQCFTELHPQYIKRGCMLPSSLNRTFICKCPLCNDKPSYDETYYTYSTIRDWKFDNERLQRPLSQGTELFCKVCKTAGWNDSLDNNCKLGKKTEHMVCGRNQFCFININKQYDQVTRGCTDTPAYNSMYFFCNYSFCNYHSVENPAKSKRNALEADRENVLTAASGSENTVVNLLGVTAMYILVLNVY